MRKRRGRARPPAAPGIKGEYFAENMRRKTNIFPLFSKQNFDTLPDNRSRDSRPRGRRPRPGCTCCNTPAMHSFWQIYHFEFELKFYSKDIFHFQGLVKEVIRQTDGRLFL